MDWIKGSPGLGNHAAKCLCNASYQYNGFLGTITVELVFEISSSVSKNILKI